MKRNVSLEEISDGKLYLADDLAKADCLGCKGCSDCCHGMGNTIVLDPLDVYNMTTGLNESFEALLSDRLVLSVVDGFVLPSLKMSEATGGCMCLSEEGRCTIHPYRPGICRLFPMGRVYMDGGFKYFLQSNECKLSARAKIKVKKLLEVQDIREYEKFVNTWHYFLEDLYKSISAKGDDAYIRSVSMGILKLFYMTPYNSEDGFYKEFYRRLESVK